MDSKERILIADSVWPAISMLIFISILGYLNINEWISFGLVVFILVLAFIIYAVYSDKNEKRRKT